MAADILKAADWFQIMSYSYRRWPAGVTTCRVIGGVFALAGAAALVDALL
ncbi:MULTISPECIES: hypothetical protein [unclassified Streptomyces]|nr:MULTISPECIES: hypothetical protein [unclassified Streptomyces]